MLTVEGRTRIQWRGPATWKDGHAQKCVKRYRELGKQESGVTVTKFLRSLPSDDHQFKKEVLESVGELSDVRSQIVLKMLVLGTKWATWRVVSHKMDSSM